MFSQRGQTVVLDRTAVPLNDIINSLITKRNFRITRQQFPISNEEILAAIEYYIDHKSSGNAKHEKISFEVSTDDIGEINVNTESMTDWVFLNCLLYGHMFYPDLEDLNRLYAKGLENIVKEILQDLQQGNTDFKGSALHDLVYESFIESYGELKAIDIEMLLTSLGENPNDNP
jgi:uncharacterized protein (DUF433 family)